ncbi:MAG: hypothetical protein ACXV8Q_00280 [Methylobacter sp.]
MKFQSWPRSLRLLSTFALIAAIAFLFYINVAPGPGLSSKEIESRKEIEELFEPGTPPPPINGSASKTDISSDISDLFEVTPSDIERAYKPKKESKQELAIQRMAQKLFEAPSDSTNQVNRDDR